MGNSLSKMQKKQYEEIKMLFSESKTINLSDKDKARLLDVLILLEQRGCIRAIKVDGGNAYIQCGSFDSFTEWYKDQDREEKSLSAREWKIAIVSAVIGLIPFIVSTVIPWIGMVVIPWISSLFGRL